MRGVCLNPDQISVVGVNRKGHVILTLFLPGGGDFTPQSTFRQFSSDVLIRGGSNYTLNSSFVITEHIKLVPGQKNFPTARESPPKSAG